ncbi:GH1 family beta-glucosidase [Alteromonas ponticola]|uniref:Beta-glucosidase n=1 Tax=Alteromonas aquimaris TaxID=2998417 RepID=A0ABT3P8P0_9ALTE|nr:GH1 family beta-glucosidase [Alteromonas aquimaris]MCW8109138.1 GH1 family beta-glucosidase [Alteromonas aquimaris]
MSNRLTLNPHFRSNTFTFGVATSSFQIEGAAASREESIWDRFCQQPGKILDGSNGKVACDHVNRWQEDLEIIASLNVDAYRFSVSWPRIIRANGSINQAGLDFYIALLDKLNAKGIKAYVTLYHWDLPQYLEDEGGWLNRDTAFAFAQYVEVIVKAFGDRVYSYATLNEPFCSAYLGYEVGVHAPGKAKKEYGKKAIHHLLLAHGLAMKELRAHAPAAQSGIVLNFTPFYPASPSEEDARATELAHIHFNDWYIRPIVEGRYPALIEDIPQSHRPDIQPGDLELIAQPIDYLGVNYYTRARIKCDAPNDPVHLPPPESSEQTAMGWEVYPRGLSDLLLQLHRDFTLPPIIITENGLASDDHLVNGEIDDQQRIRYLQDHLDAVAVAMDQGVNITGYFVWSLLDNFEWALGYEKRFGIVYVDYETQKRTLKNSALALAATLLSRQQ